MQCFHLQGQAIREVILLGLLDPDYQGTLILQNINVTCQATKHHISEDVHLLIHKMLQAAWCHFNMTLYPYLDSVQKLLWVIFSSVGSHLYQIHQPARITTS